GAADGFVAAGDGDGCVKLFGGLNELRRSPRMQAFFVDDLYLAHDGNVVRWRPWTRLPLSTRLPMVPYLRPAPWAPPNASCNGLISRIFASLISIGRFIPARTSTLGWLITEMARFDGVPPNMSVRIATPSPLSTRLTASRIFLRHCSTSSSGPIVIASIWRWGPTTCSSAERNSMASRPWVTSTRPIIPNSSRALRFTARKGAHSRPIEAPLQGLGGVYRQSAALRKDGAKVGLGACFFGGRDPRPGVVNFPRSDRGRRGSQLTPGGQLPPGRMHCCQYHWKGRRSGCDR